MEMEKKESSLSDLVEERFPMALRVLLVEADDSTRQIITALLRKCSYRVSAVPDGLKAWETLKRRPHDIDLILTEVELPLISGYALLTLIMEHDICKNIPIIMMSSQDSISIVLKCMMKGTADFLIKPVRKNELRTLWQHVWRRQTKTVGNVPGNRAVKQQKVEVSSENNASSNYSIDYLDSDPKNKECSEKGSDAQGLSQLRWGSGFNTRNTEPEECMTLVEKSFMPKSEIGGKSIGIEPGSAYCNEPFKSNAFMCNGGVFSRTLNLDVDFGPGSRSGHVNNNVEVNFHAIDLGDPSSGALDLIGKFDGRPKDTCRNLSANDETNKFSFTPELELSLRRFQPIYPKNEDTGEGHVLNHSNASAFSRYDDSKASWPFFPTLTSNSTELKDGPTTFYNELSDHSPESTVGTISHGASLSNQENMSTLFNGQSGHSETAFPGPQMGFISIPGVKFDSSCPDYRQIFPPVIYTESGFPPLWSAKGQREHSPFLMSSSFHSSSEIDNSEQTVREETTNHSGGQPAREGDKDSVKVEREGSAAPGLSGIGSICEGIAENMCGGCDSDATPATSAVRPSASDSVNDSRLFIHDGSRGINAHCSSQREAALMKFRLKRKDRCFEKKVRYQSRKRLAEQRPRVKGQFVRQVQTEPSPAES